MDRSAMIRKPLVLIAATLASSALGASRQPAPVERAPSANAPASQGQPADRTAPAGRAGSADAAAATLLERAETIRPGTYSVEGTAVATSADELPVVVQADALRGEQMTVRVVVALGARAQQPVVTRARIVAANQAGGPRRVLADISGTSAAGLVRTVGSTSLPPGDYELQAVVAQPGRARPVLAALARSPLRIPDLWQGKLAASPIVLADAVSEAPASAAGSPFAFWPTALRPATSDRFSQSAQLQVAFRIYNWTAPAEQKPDLQVEYVFYEQTPRRGVFFNKVKPQLLNGVTLGDRFDPASGAVNAGISVPLAPFPPGEFKLAVRVTDNRSRQTASQETRFFVVP
jgi:hypothetical protein